jgi:branched-chain amino acid aminotransferase
MVTTHDALEDPRNADILIYVNGALKHRDEAVVSVYDSGFLLGDGMWEGMRLYDGVWAFFDAHMDRFFDSCKTVSLDPGMDRAGIFEALEMTRKANGMETDVHCRLMLTRGVKVRPFQHPRSAGRVPRSSSSWSIPSPWTGCGSAASGWPPCRRCAGCR